MRQNIKRNFSALPVALFVFLLFLAIPVFAQDAPASNGNVSDKQSGLQAAAGTTSALNLTVREIARQEAEIQKDITDTESAFQDLESEAQKLLTQEENLKREVRQKEDEVESVREEIASLKADFAKTRDVGLSKSIKDLSGRLKSLQKDLSASKKALAAVTAKTDAAQKELDLRKGKVSELRGILDTLKKVRDSKATLVEKLIRVLIIIFFGIFFFFFVKFAIRKFEEVITEKEVLRESEITLRMKTISRLFYWLGAVGIVFVSIYMIMETFGFDMAPLLAGAGIVGLAFGFGGQYLIRDVINGFFILIEGQFRINDVVKIGDLGGLVESINLRTTILRDLEGRVIIIPNGEIKSVINFTKEYAHALIDLGVAYKEDVDRVMQVIKDLGKEIRQDKYFGRLILADLEMLGVDDFADSQVTIKFRLKTLPIKQWEVAREFRRRIKNRFDELGIEIPFPHRTLYMGSGPENDWLRALAQKYSGPVQKQDK